MAVNLDNTLFVKSLMYKQQLLDQQRQERAVKEQQASQNMTQAMRDFQDMMKMYEASRQSSMEHALTLAQAQGKSAGQQGKDKPSFNTPEQQQGAEIGYGEGHRDFIKFAGEEAKWRVEQKYKDAQIHHYENLDEQGNANLGLLREKLAQMPEQLKTQQARTEAYKEQVATQRGNLAEKKLKREQVDIPSMNERATSKKRKDTITLLGIKSGLIKSAKPGETASLIDETAMPNFKKELDAAGIPITQALEDLGFKTQMSMPQEQIPQAVVNPEDDFIKRKLGQ